MDEFSVAIISLVVSTVASLLVCYFSYRQNFNQHYSATISNERMVWIKETRKLVAEFLMLCETYDKLDGDSIKEFNRLKNEILLNLNSNADKYPKDEVVRGILTSEKGFSKIKEKAPCLRNAFIELFKNEWDKAKLEAGRSKYQVIKLGVKSKALAKPFENKQK